MVRDAADGTFSIVVQNTEGCKERPLDCYRLIKIYYQDKEYIMKRSEAGIPIFVTPKRVLPIPGQLPGIRTEMSAHFIVVSLDTVGAKIKWDGQVANTLVLIFPWLLQAHFCSNWFKWKLKKIYGTERKVCAEKLMVTPTMTYVQKTKSHQRIL